MPVISLPGVQPAQVPHPVSKAIGHVFSPGRGQPACLPETCTARRGGANKGSAGCLVRMPLHSTHTRRHHPVRARKRLLRRSCESQAHLTTAGLRERKRTVKGAPGRYNGRVLRDAVWPVERAERLPARDNHVEHGSEGSHRKCSHKGAFLRSGICKRGLQRRTGRGEEQEGRRAPARPAPTATLCELQQGRNPPRA
jgi:hypothetical protein